MVLWTALKKYTAFSCLFYINNWWMSLLIEISQPCALKNISLSSHPHNSSFSLPPIQLLFQFFTLHSFFLLPHLFSVYRHLFFEGFSSSIHSRLCHIGSTWKMRTLVFWVGKLSRHHVRRSILSTQLWSQKSHPFGFRKYQFSFGIRMCFVHLWKTNPSLNWNVM